ncbi:hypothetical protein [Shewanella gelidii]|uniref:hypothetical protein n=1 Tax=Shewanella gelidii TaxID=1642821 RepID=UPI00166E12C7|nr:hypothetical protein [Shewanella gelidii]MCL1097093.1 hypothetical protein [Shewanella gelidii]
MTADDFIEDKAPQLAFYCRAMLSGQIDFQEIQHYLWDTLEEWQQLHTPGEADTDLERVFWYTLHTLDEWPAWMFKANQQLRELVSDCSTYLCIGGQLPKNCIGIRP